MKPRLFCLWLLLSAAVGLFAYDFQYGDLYYNITSDSTVEVTYQIKLSFQNYAGLLSANIPASIEYVGKNYSVTSIGEYAFCGCRSLTSITISNSVTSTGEYAFYGCSGLTSITIGNSVTSIGGSAFFYCSGLTSVVWNAVNYPDSQDGHTPFYILCPQITSFVFGDSIEHIPAYLCSEMSSLSSITIPNSVTSIGAGAFSGCSGLTSITIPNSVTSIGEGAFSGCSSLTSITIPNSVTSIGDYAFYNAYNIVYSGTATGAPWGARSMNGYIDGFLVYSDATKTSLLACSCAAKGTITIPNSVTSIGEYAFSGCSGLTSITIPNSVTSIGEYAFYGCSGLTSITIPNGVTSIGDGVFKGCSGLTSITIGNSVTSIGKSAFYGCSGLTSITIPNSVTSIGEYAFYGCINMTSITFLGRVPSIAYNRVFERCTNIHKLVCENDNVKLTDLIDFPFIQTLDTIVMPANGFDVSEEKWASLPKYLKYAKLTGGEMTDNAFAVLNRSYKTLQTLDIQAVSNTSIADEAFKGCYNLRTLLLPSQLTKIPYMAVADCKSLQEITIPATVEEIDNSAFENCRSIQTITFAGADAPQGIAQYAPASGCALHRIGNWAFYNCHELQHLTIPEGVTEIGDAAFYGCTYLQDLTLPASVEQIGDNCFALCSKLQKITVLSTTPPAIAAKTFYDVNRAIPVYVPAESVADYQGDTYWKEFNIQADTTPIDHTQADGTASATPHKVVRDGQVLIIRGDKTYTATGIEVR